VSCFSVVPTSAVWRAVRRFHEKHVATCLGRGDARPHGRAIGAVRHIQPGRRIASRVYPALTPRGRERAGTVVSEGAEEGSGDPDDERWSNFSA
jgi:hypothetical protein